MTCGSRHLETLAPLTSAGLTVRDILVLIDREQGGAEELAERGYALHAVLTLSALLNVLVDNGKLESARRDEVMTWINTQR